MDTFTDSKAFVGIAPEVSQNSLQAIQAEGLGLQINGRWIFRNLNLEFRPGEFSVLRGKSGSGKTSLLRVLSGSYAPSEGRLCAIPPKSLSLIFQDLCLSPQLSALTNVMTGRLSWLGWWRFLFGFNSRWAGEAFQLLESLGLRDQVLQATGSLSGGEKQRVAVARGLFQDAPIILADEPVSSMDCKMASCVLERLKSEAVNKNKIVICALHQDHLIDSFADQVIDFGS